MSKLGFWAKLKKPILCLAPMADVTDCAFRQIIAKYSRHGEADGGPDVFYTEFVSADGLAHPLAREKLLVDLKYSDGEHPIVAQIFGGKPKNIKIASALCRKLGFDGIDINMGCPDRSVEKQCAGAAMMKNPKLAREIIRAAKEGAQGLPVSVKTRIGYNKNEIETWIRELLEEDLAALIVHLRTRKEMSDVPAHWDLMPRIVEIRDEMTAASGGAREKTLILGNGDVEDTDDARKKCEETGCDGVMLGRAIFGNPWLFAECQSVSLTEDMSKRHFDIKERLRVMVEHTELFEKVMSGHKNFAVMKKHYKAYVNGFDGAKELRMKLMEAENTSQIEAMVNDFLKKN